MSDLISRQAAIEVLENDKAALDKIIKGMSAMDVRLDAYVSQRNQVVYDIYAIKQLPPIQPKRGRWIKLDMHRGMADHKCTACEQECYVPTCMGEPMYAFCPNCGAKMEVTT